MKHAKLARCRLAAVCGALILGGCATVELSSAGSLKGGERLLVIQNNGYELLWQIPLWSGDLSWDAKAKRVNRTPVLFRNHADIRHLYAMAEKIAARENCELTNVTFVDNFIALNPDSFYGAIRADDVAISAVLRPRR